MRVSAVYTVDYIVIIQFCLLFTLRPAAVVPMRWVKPGGVRPVPGPTRSGRVL